MKLTTYLDIIGNNSSLFQMYRRTLRYTRIEERGRQSKVAAGYGNLTQMKDIGKACQATLTVAAARDYEKTVARTHDIEILKLFDDEIIRKGDTGRRQRMEQARKLTTRADAGWWKGQAHAAAWE
jgi:hypothetical protein